MVLLFNLTDLILWYHSVVREMEIGLLNILAKILNVSFFIGKFKMPKNVACFIFRSNRKKRKI